MEGNVLTVQCFPSLCGISILKVIIAVPHFLKHMNRTMKLIVQNGKASYTRMHLIHQKNMV